MIKDDNEFLEAAKQLRGRQPFENYKIYKVTGRLLRSIINHGKWFEKFRASQRRASNARWRKKTDE